MTEWTKNNPLFLLTHFDGRNFLKLISLRPQFSEFAWINKRFFIMVQYTIFLYELLNKKKVSTNIRQQTDFLCKNLSLRDALAIKKIENTINHDLKAIQIYIEKKLTLLHLPLLLPYINLGIGSEDINSISLALLLKENRDTVCLPHINDIGKKLLSISDMYKNTPMLGRTHGLPAGLTTYGKEIGVTLSRLTCEFELLKSCCFEAKLSGELGSFSVHEVLSPTVQWKKETDRFIQSLGLTPSAITTQIAPYDSIVRYFQSLYRLNAILLDFVKNQWLYVMLGYLTVVSIQKEVGSAGMPHKVNPMYFEGAEGGLLMANGLIETLTRTLMENRLQRDFHDSTVRRNFVFPLAYSVLSYQSILEGLNRTTFNTVCVSNDIQNHPESFIEIIKTYGITHHIPRCYDMLKRKTRGKPVTKDDLLAIIQSFKISDTDKKQLRFHIQNPSVRFAQQLTEAVIAKGKKVFV